MRKISKRPKLDVKILKPRSLGFFLYRLPTSITVNDLNHGIYIAINELI